MHPHPILPTFCSDSFFGHWHAAVVTQQLGSDSAMLKGVSPVATAIKDLVLLEHEFWQRKAQLDWAIRTR